MYKYVDNEIFMYYNNPRKLFPNSYIDVDAILMSEFKFIYYKY